MIIVQRDRMFLHLLAHGNSSGARERVRYCQKARYHTISVRHNHDVEMLHGSNSQHVHRKGDPTDAILEKWCFVDCLPRIICCSYLNDVRRVKLSGAVCGEYAYQCMLTRRFHKTQSCQNWSGYHACRCKLCALHVTSAVFRCLPSSSGGSSETLLR